MPQELRLSLPLPPPLSLPYLIVALPVLLLGHLCRVDSPSRKAPDRYVPGASAGSVSRPFDGLSRLREMARKRQRHAMRAFLDREVAERKRSSEARMSQFLATAEELGSMLVAMDAERVHAHRQQYHHPPERVNGASVVATPQSAAMGGAAVDNRQGPVNDHLPLVPSPKPQPLGAGTSERWVESDSSSAASSRVPWISFADRVQASAPPGARSAGGHGAVDDHGPPFSTRAKAGAGAGSQNGQDRARSPSGGELRTSMRTPRNRGGPRRTPPAQRAASHQRSDPSDGDAAAAWYSEPDRYDFSGARRWWPRRPAQHRPEEGGGGLRPTGSSSSRPRAAERSNLY